MRWVEGRFPEWTWLTRKAWAWRAGQEHDETQREATYLQAARFVRFAAERILSGWDLGRGRCGADLKAGAACLWSGKMERRKLGRSGPEVGVIGPRTWYADLPAPASECIACGVCEERCPFGVEVMAKMRQAVELFEPAGPGL